MLARLTLAHLSDVHLGPLPRLPLSHLNAKRALGAINWHRNRRHVHRTETIDAILADLAAHAPDHIAVSGDLVNIGLPEEYAAALRWLQTLGPPDRVTVVPGNHDIYTTLRADPGVGRWQAYMTSDDAGAGIMSQAGVTPDPGTFPFVRCLGPVALVGLNSAHPTAPFHAGGRLGPAQLERLDAILARLGEARMTRVVLIHHPPLPGLAQPVKALADAADLETVLLRRAPELVLHGHNHRSMLSVRHSHAGPVPVLGVPSASLGRAHKSETLARYHLFRFTPASGGPGKIELTARGLAMPDGPVVEIERRLLTATAPAAPTDA